MWCAGTTSPFRWTASNRLEALNEAFRAALAPVLVGATSQLHALRVTLTGATALHRLEARQPGTLAAAVRGAAQDVTEAKIWIEQVKATLSTPLDRAQSARRQDAIGELIRLVDGIGGDAVALRQWVRGTLGDCLDNLPPEVAAGEIPQGDGPEDLRRLLLEAEATVLARLAAR